MPRHHPSVPVSTEPEPLVLCGLPVGAAVGILGSGLMICQVFGLFFLSPFLLYFFEISIGSAMMFILSSGAKHRKIAYITAYMLYISMYTFWVFFLILGTILATIFFVDNNDNVCDPNMATTVKSCIPEKFTTGDVEIVIISCFFLTVSIIVAIVQMRYLMILYHFLRKLSYRLPSHHPNGFNVQYVVPTPISPNGLPPPPRYSVHVPPIGSNAATTKSALPNENGITEPHIVTSTPILGVENLHTGNDNLSFGTDEEANNIMPARPPAYSDVVEPRNVTITSHVPPTNEESSNTTN